MGWLLIFILLIFFIFISALNFYCWKGIHFSFSLDLVLLIFFFGLVITFHFWFRDLLREKLKKYEILLMVLFLGFFIFLASEALLFISFFWASFHSSSSPTLGIWPGEAFYVPDPMELTFANTLISFILAWTFISLQIKEFRVMGLFINDSVYSSVFFFLGVLVFQKKKKKKKKKKS